MMENMLETADVTHVRGCMITVKVRLNSYSSSFCDYISCVGSNV